MTSPLCRAVGVDDHRLAAILDALAARRWSVATAESLTAGLLAAVLTEMPGASAVVRGGLVCYATDLKAALAGVDPGLLDRLGPVDPAVATALAHGARRACGGDLGIGLTGVAGPEPQGGKEVGTVFVAVAGQGLTICRAMPMESVPACRPEIRAAAVRFALDLLAEAVGQG